MKNRLLLALVVLAVLAAAVYYFRPAGVSQPAVALIDLYPQAEKRSNLPLEAAFKLTDLTVNGETRKGIFMHPTSRLIYKQMAVPLDAWLRVWVALDPEVWERPDGDGVLFRFGVSDGRTHDELVKQHVDPLNNPNDRRWIPIEVDLSAYGGLTVDLIFNTNSSLPGRGDNAANDWAVWGSPELFIHR
jgi:hypothetical protein